MNFCFTLNIYVFSFIFLTYKLNINYKEHFIDSTPFADSSHTQLQNHQLNDV